MNEGFLVVRYLYEQRPDGRYIPKVSVQLAGKAKPSSSPILKAGPIAILIVHWSWISGF